MLRSHHPPCDHPTPLKEDGESHINNFGGRSIDPMTTARRGEERMKIDERERGKSVAMAHFFGGLAM
jgi:hypothetical protein